MSVFPTFDAERVAALESRLAELRQQIGEPAIEFERAVRELWAQRFLGERVIADPLDAYDFIRPDDDAPSSASS